MRYVKTLTLALVLFSTEAFAQLPNTINLGVPEFSINASAGTSNVAGTAFAMPAAASVITWQTSFTNTPSSVTYLLQGSTDNSTWGTMDTSTNTAGEVRNIISASPFIRAFLSAKGPGGTSTATLTVKAPQTVGGISATPTFLLASGSSSSPSLSFAVEPTLGLYRSSAGVISNTGSLIVPSSLSPSPTLSFSGAPTTGLTQPFAGTYLGITVAGVNDWLYGSGGAQYISSLGQFNFTNGATNGTVDLRIRRGAAKTLSIDDGAAGPAVMSIAPFIFANIATFMTANGQIGYCSDCTIANPCASGGNGAFAKRLNGVNVCN